MEKSISEILLRRRHCIVATEIPETVKPYNRSLALTISRNINSLGFTLDGSALEYVASKDASWIVDFNKELVEALEPLVGADVDYNPMYHNFPKCVMDAEATELFWNAIIHYWSGGTLLPAYEKDRRFPLVDNGKVTVIGVCAESEIFELFKNLIGSKTSLSPQDIADVEEIVKAYSISKLLPDEIPLKENVALVGKLVLKYAPMDYEEIFKYYKTATDVLRLITALSDGDVSLATNTRFKPMSRKIRRIIMDLLVNCGDIQEDLLRHNEVWKRAIFRVHPNTFTRKKYERTVEMLKRLRSDSLPTSFAGRVQDYIDRGEIIRAVALLKSRPSELARRLDHLLRETSHKAVVVEVFNDVAEEVSTNVLLQVRQHFIGRSYDAMRVAFPKGSTAKAYLLPTAKEIDKVYCDSIVDICEEALIKNYRNRDYMGKVFIDEEFKKFIVPFSQWSASKTSKVVSRGSRLAVDGNNVIRAFIWWTNINDKYGEDRVDIDLSAAMYDENMNYITHIGWTNLRDATIESCHSGDITNGGSPDGAGVAEFIDFNVAKAGNVRYVAFQIFSYTGQKFSEMNNLKFGWMLRDEIGSGEIFEPKTVEMAMTVSSESTHCMPVIYDVVKQEFVWCDIAVGMPESCGAIENTKNAARLAMLAMVNMNKTNLYDLILFNAMARGMVVKDRSKADIVFSNDTTKPKELVMRMSENGDSVSFEVKERDVKIITAYDSDYFMAAI